MKKSILFAITGFLIFGAAVMLTRVCVSETDSVDLEAYYGNIIDRVITECQRKSRLRSDRIERVSVFNCFKATYFKLRRKDLIAELTNTNIVKNEFLTRYHLNRSFYETTREPALL